ncbi:hypothetical protein ACFX2H_008729 [Malus domestica]
MGRLAPLSEEPIINGEGAANRSSKGILRSTQPWRNWIKTHLSPLVLFHKRSDFKVLLGVLGCPLFPVSALPKLPLNEVLIPSFLVIGGHDLIDHEFIMCLDHLVPWYAEQST